jgi:hypothetical protein
MVISEVIKEYPNGLDWHRQSGHAGPDPGAVGKPQGSLTN